MKLIRAADLEFIAAGHENPAAPGVWKKVLLQRGDMLPGTVQMVNWARLPGGKSFAAHYHEDMQELFVILRGAPRIIVGKQTAQLHEGDAIVIDANEVHEMFNDSDEDIDYLAMGITASTGGRTIVV